MHVETLQLPAGIRIWESELKNPPQPLREGYLFAPLENADDSYRFSAVAEPERIAAIFADFGRLLPEECFFILEFYEEEIDPGAEDHPAPAVYYSPYLPTEEMLPLLEPYLPRLVHDGFVGFGLANNRAGIEIFYSEEKVLTCFTDNHLRVMNLFAQRQLHHDPALPFPTDLGHDHYSLLCHPREILPAAFAGMNDRELDYVHFCRELVELLDMYPVEETLSFFLSKREQDEIELCLTSHAEFSEFAEEDFGSLLLDWSDFARECEEGFQGDLWEYRMGLKLRDMIQFAVEGVSRPLAGKLLEIITEADSTLRRALTDRRKRLDPPEDLPLRDERFWYQGVVRKQGSSLRRDLIRHGWYQS